jgi:hypothetical protein
MRTIDRLWQFTIHYLINTWLQPGAVCGGAEKPLKRLSMRGTPVTTLKRGVNETLLGKLAFHRNALQCAHA